MRGDVFIVIQSLHVMVVVVVVVRHRAESLAVVMVEVVVVGEVLVYRREGTVGETGAMYCSAWVPDMPTPRGWDCG